MNAACSLKGRGVVQRASWTCRCKLDCRMRKHSVLTRKGGLHGLHGAYWCSCTLQAPTLGNAPACSTCECSVWRSLDSNRLSAQQRPTVALEARACMAASGVNRYWEAGLSVQERFGEISGLTGQQIIFPHTALARRTAPSSSSPRTARGTSCRTSSIPGSTMS